MQQYEVEVHASGRWYKMTGDDDDDIVAGVLERLEPWFDKEAYADDHWSHDPTDGERWIDVYADDPHEWILTIHWYPSKLNLKHAAAPTTAAFVTPIP